jgi:MFS family permease
MIAAEILAMLGSSAVAATLPTLIAEWGLSPAQAGSLSGLYFVGYALAVPILVTLTDRIDSRIIFAGGCLVGIVAALGFALFARGFASASGLWALAGVSLAGVYMPGLRVIIDRVDAEFRLRAVPYYTASFGIGISLSFLVAGTVAQLAGWRTAFAAAALGCVAACACLVFGTAGIPRNDASRRQPSALDLRSVLTNVPALRYIAAYGGHCWELFALRAWLVALLLFAWKHATSADAGHALTYWSSAIALAGVPASIVGAEYALRAPRRRVIARIALASVVVALVLAALGTSAFLVAAIGLVVYNVAIAGDSGAITAGLVEAAKPETQGATLALHSLVGFVGGALGPIAVGLALTTVGGLSSVAGWSAALVVMAAGSALAAVVVSYSSPAT